MGTILAVLVAVPAMAQPIVQQGIDALSTAGGSSADINLPADFFCPGSPPINTTIAMTGVPITTSPPNALGGADTVIERLKDADLSSGCATVPTVVRAVSLKNAAGQTISACGYNWRVDACTCGCADSPQPITTLTLCDDGSGGGSCGVCGTFTGQLLFDVCLTFTNTTTGAVVGPVTDQIDLNVNTPWCDTNPGGVIEYSAPLAIDTECDGQANWVVPCTTNFFPGATCGGGQCPEPQCHFNPGGSHDHCVEQPCNFCGDGTCDPGENCNNCSSDCAGYVATGDATAKAQTIPGETEIEPYCCGNGTRETAETRAICHDNF